jgi:hypothetical protein
VIIPWPPEPESLISYLSFILYILVLDRGWGNS